MNMRVNGKLQFLPFERGSRRKEAHISLSECSQSLLTSAATSNPECHAKVALL